MKPDLLSAALRYAAKGWLVLPLHTPADASANSSLHKGVCSCTKRTACQSAGKHPRTPQGHHNASADESVIRSWWSRFPDANIGIRLGVQSGIVALDIDPRNGGKPAIAALITELGALKKSLYWLTGGGGWHILFQFPDGISFPKATTLLAPGVEFKTDGFIVAPPSLHKSGERYTRPAGVSFNLTPDPLPDTWLKFALDKMSSPVSVSPLQKSVDNSTIENSTVDSSLGESSSSQPAAAPQLELLPKTILNGHRNTTLFSLACSLRGKGFEQPELFAALKTLNDSRCANPPDDPRPSDDDLTALVRRVCRTYPAGFFTVPTPPATAPSLKTLQPPVLQSTSVETHFPSALPANRLPLSAIPDGFFRQTLHYLDTQTDAPVEFLYTSLLTAVSAAVGNRIALRFGATVIKPNLYALLLAGSSVARKSTALGKAADWLRALERRVDEPAAFSDTLSKTPSLASLKFLYPQSGSTEGLLDAMRQARDGETAHTPQSFGLAVYSEFASLLEQDAKKYNGDLKTFYTDVYDGRSHRRKLKNEESRIDNPCLSVLAASTLEQFQAKISEDDKYSGFLQRFLFCHVPKATKPPVALVDLSPPDAAEEQRIESSFLRIAQTAVHLSDARFTLTPEAAARYRESFQRDHIELNRMEKEGSEKGSLLRSYYARLDIMKFKVALIYAVAALADSDCSGIREVELSGDLMNQAIEAVQYFQCNVKHLLMNEFVFTRPVQRQKRLLDILHKNGGNLNRRVLLQHSHLSASEFAEVLRTLEEQGSVSIAQAVTPGGQRTTLVSLASQQELVANS